MTGGRLVNAEEVIERKQQQTFIKIKQRREIFYKIIPFKFEYVVISLIVLLGLHGQSLKVVNSRAPVRTKWTTTSDKSRIGRRSNKTLFWVCRIVV